MATTPSFRVGDRVKVIRTGQKFSTASDVAHLMGISDTYANGDHCSIQNLQGTVDAMLQRGVTLYVAIRLDSEPYKHYIISHSGLALVKRAPIDTFTDDELFTV